MRARASSSSCCCRSARWCRKDLSEIALTTMKLRSDICRHFPLCKITVDPRYNPPQRSPLLSALMTPPA
ncbi:hypothetical protein AB1Y20_009123 [Prymnesium parvum]|uniref:Uncharacterized protein n=1 Tax=Prymnesium parvum TaxID=97485 RepID=A0AB34K3F9_PRYPA